MNKTFHLASPGSWRAELCSHKLFLYKQDLSRGGGVRSMGVGMRPSRRAQGSGSNHQGPDRCEVRLGPTPWWVLYNLQAPWKNWVFRKKAHVYQPKNIRGMGVNWGNRGPRRDDGALDLGDHSVCTTPKPTCPCTHTRAPHVYQADLLRQVGPITSDQVGSLGLSSPRFMKASRVRGKL